MSLNRLGFTFSKHSQAIRLQLLHYTFVCKSMGFPLPEEAGIALDSNFSVCIIVATKEKRLRAFLFVFPGEHGPQRRVQCRAGSSILVPRFCMRNDEELGFQ